MFICPILYFIKYPLENSYQSLIFVFFCYFLFHFFTFVGFKYKLNNVLLSNPMKILIMPHKFLFFSLVFFLISILLFSPILYHFSDFIFEPREILCRFENGMGILLLFFYDVSIFSFNFCS